MAKNRMDYQYLFDRSSLAMGIADKKKQLALCNKSFLDLFSLEKKKLRDYKFHELFQFSDEKLNFIEKNLTETNDFLGSVECHKTTGHSFLSRLNVRRVQLPFELGFGYCFEVYPNAITSSQPLDCTQVGRVVGKISHEISNPLSIMKIHCDGFGLIMEKEKSIPGEVLLQKVKKISHATNRVVDANKELRFFAKSLLSNDSQEIEGLWEKYDKEDSKGFNDH